MELFKKNRFWVGLLVALAFPIMAFGVILMLFEFGTSAGLVDDVADPMGGKRLRTTSLIAICCNIFLIQYFNKRYSQNILRGILVITFIAAIIWFLAFQDELLSEF